MNAKPEPSAADILRAVTESAAERLYEAAIDPNVSDAQFLELRRLAADPHLFAEIAQEVALTVVCEGGRG